MPTPQESDLLSRRQALVRTARTVVATNSAVTVVEHGPQLITGTITLIETLRLAEIRSSRWVKRNTLYKTEDGLVVPIKKVTIGDSLGKGFVDNNTTEHPPDGIVTKYVNKYLAQNTWESKNFAEIGATSADALAGLSPSSPVVAELKNGGNIDVTISLLGNDLGNSILRDFGSFENFEQYVQGPFNALKAMQYLSHALGEYKTNLKAIIRRLNEIRTGGADIKRMILQGPPNFGMANGVSVRIPQPEGKGYMTKIINLKGNKNAQLFGSILAIELFLAQNDVLDEIGAQVGLECLLTDNFGITAFASDQHLLPEGYAEMAFNQTGRFIGEFDGSRQNFNTAMRVNHLTA